MSGSNQNFCSWIDMMSKECLEPLCQWTTRWRFSTLFGHMLLRHWILARRQGRHVMDPRDQGKQRYWTRRMLTVLIKPVQGYSTLSQGLKTCWSVGLMCPTPLPRLRPLNKVSSTYIQTERFGNGGSIIKSGRLYRLAWWYQFCRPCKATRNPQPTTLEKACGCNSSEMWSCCYNSQTMSLFGFDTR